MTGFLTRLRRKRILERPVPADWRRLIEEEIPMSRALPAADRAALYPLVQVFCAEKRFRGCAEFTVGERERVVIATQACLLLLRRETDIYPGVDHILVYPDAFLVPVQDWSEDGMVVTEHAEVRIGEAGAYGDVVLSWQDIEADLTRPWTGQNVVVHEFAHQLDLENGASDGTPRLPNSAAYREWADALQPAFDRLCAAADAGEYTFIDPYAAQNPAEFFAVVSEYFFCMPGELHARHPDLYAHMQSYYRQDPAREWVLE